MFSEWSVCKKKATLRNQFYKKQDPKSLGILKKLRSSMVGIRGIDLD